MCISAPKLDSDAGDVATLDALLHIVLADGRERIVPLEWFPRLRCDGGAGGGNWRLIGSGQGIHWPDIDEDISVASLPRTG